MNLTTSGKIGMLNLLREADTYLAWGIGDPAWDTGGTPNFADSATALVSELGRRKLTIKQWVLPQVGGEININGVEYTLSPDPTRYLYCKVIFGVDEEPTAEIREYGLFQGVEVVLADPNLPGQMYFEVAAVTNPGTLILGANFDKITRSDIVQETFEFVIHL